MDDAKKRHPLALDNRAPIPYEWPLEARNENVVAGEVMILTTLIFGFIASGWFALAAYIGVTVFLATTFQRAAAMDFFLYVAGRSRGDNGVRNRSRGF
jgi:hypothetical protein